MKSAKLFLTIVLVLATCLANSAYASPHSVYGYCADADDGTPADGSLITTYIESRPDEILTYVVGSGDVPNGWIIDAGNFLTQWESGEILIIEVYKITAMVQPAEYFDRTAVILTTAGFDEAPDMKLKLQSDSGYLALVMGQIIDIDTQTGVSGATVEIECLNNSNTATTTSDENGDYYATLACPIGELIEVTATMGTESGANTGVVQDIGTIGTEVDVGLANIDVTIPEFPIAALPALLSIFSLGLVRRRLF